MRLNNFRIPAAIVGLVPTTIAGFILIASTKIEPVMAAPDMMEMWNHVPGDFNPFLPPQRRVGASKGSRLDMISPKNLSPQNSNQASFIKITAGEWLFCDGPSLGDPCITLGRGNHDLNQVRGGFNDRISSFKRIR